jgi:hypothetical protein
LKAPIFLALLMVIWPLYRLAQTPADPNAASGVEVTKYSWNKHRPPTTSQNVNQSDYTITQIRTDLELARQERSNRNSIENQSRDLRTVEENAKRDIIYGKGADMYRYVVGFKNNGTKTIKTIFWDYQFAEPADPENPNHRQFRCNVKIKPDSNKNLEAFTTKPPTRVVNAQSQGKPLEQKVVITRLEYTDGTSWQRSDWSPPSAADEKPNWRTPCLPI